MAMKRAGWKVTGSDVGIYPPISTYLKEQNVEYYTGWHPDKMGKPDLVVVGNVAGSENPEWQYVQEKKIPYVSYPELIAKYFVKPNSIVCAGTYGKTTTAALLSWILYSAGYNLNFMFGGLSVNGGFPSASLDKVLKGIPPLASLGRNDNERWSILEGDEYKTARWDNSPKFAHYSPTHLLLTAVQWDHADVYPTEADYVNAFKKLLGSIPKDGLIIASERILDIKILDIQQKNIQYPLSKTYGKSADVDYRYGDIKTTKDGINFNIFHKKNKYKITSRLLGDYMSDNICAAFAMAREIGIEPEVIIKAIESFKGIKRRLEKRFDGDVTVIDDIAHSPAKARSTLETLKTDGRLIAIFEPNTGNRQTESIPSYDNPFIAADEVVIPRLTQIKRDTAKPESMDGAKLAEVIGKTHPNVKYIDDDEKLIDYLINNTKKGDVVVFLGSHGFRGMIDRLVLSFRPRPVPSGGIPFLCI